MIPETEQTKSNKQKDAKKEDAEKQDSASSYDPFAANKWQHQYGHYFGFDW